MARKWKGGNMPTVFKGDLDAQDGASYLAQFTGAQIYWNREFGKTDKDVEHDNDITDSHELAMTLEFMVHDPNSDAEPYEGDSEGRYRYRQSYMRLNSDGKGFGLKGPDAVLTKVFKALLGRSVDTNKCDFDMAGEDLEKYDSLLDLPVLLKGVKDVPELNSLLLDGEELMGKHCLLQFGYPVFGKGAAAVASEKLKIVGAMAVPATTGRKAKPKPAPEPEPEPEPLESKAEPAPKASKAKREHLAVDVDSLPKHVQTIIKRVFTPAPLSVPVEQHLDFLNHLTAKWEMPHLVDLADMTKEMARGIAQLYADKEDDGGRQMLMNEFVEYRKVLKASKPKKGEAPPPEPDEPDDLDDLLGADDEVDEADLPF